MKKIELTEELVACSARQGVTICGAEAEGRVREMWENGEVIIEQRDFTGITLGGGASAQD